MSYRTIGGMLLVLRRLRQQDRWSRAQLDAYQAQCLQRLREHVYARSPFYRTFHAGYLDRPLQELPVLTKELLQEQFEAVITDPAVRHDAVAEHVRNITGTEQFLGRYIVTATSGTTGGPAFVLFDGAEWAQVLASFSRYESHVGSLWGALRRPRIAIVASSTPWHISARIGATVRSSLLPIQRLDIGQPISSIVESLNAWQPYTLATYASMLGILAGEQQAGRLRIAPARVVSAAEVLSPATRERAEAVWGNVVFDQYGASEGGTFAVECLAHDGLHVFEDLFILEPVDHQNRPVPAGEYADKVLLTVLFNYTQPLIRYELTDSICMAAAPCPCGCTFARIQGIRGRAEDVLEFPARTGERIAVHPMIFYRILDAAPLRGWQVLQEPNRLSLRLSRGCSQIDECALIEAMRQALERQGAVAPAIVIEWQEGVQRGATGKMRRIVHAHDDNSAPQGGEVSRVIV
jgi:putative adenylate-forming enzyme